MEKIIKLIPIIEKSNSTFGSWRIPVLKEYTYSNGRKQQINSGKYFFRKADAVKWLEDNQQIERVEHDTHI